MRHPKTIEKAGTSETTTALMVAVSIYSIAAVSSPRTDRHPDRVRVGARHEVPSNRGASKA